MERTRNPSGGSASGKRTLDPNSISKALPLSSPKGGKRSITGAHDQPKKGLNFFPFQFNVFIVCSDPKEGEETKTLLQAKDLKTRSRSRSPLEEVKMDRIQEDIEAEAV